MTNWPSSLPQKLLDSSYHDEEPDLAMLTEMDAPVPKLRRRFTAAIRLFGGKMNLTADQKHDLTEFYRDYCASSFWFPDPETGDPITCIFKEKPTYESAGSGWQIVTLKFGKMP